MKLGKESSDKRGNAAKPARNLKPRWPETVALTLGLCLIGMFFHVRAEQQQDMQAGLELFASMSTLQPGNSGAIQASTFESAPPAQALWSEDRIQAYEESLAAGGDAPLAVLKISSLSIEVPVYNGADEHNLNRGVARVLGTARIAENGNLGIAGHRDGFFRGLKDIAMSDVIELQTHQGVESYRVVSTQIVQPSDVEVLAPTHNKKTLTLVTCYPFYFAGSAPERFIVKAVAEQHLVKNSMREP